MNRYEPAAVAASVLLVVLTGFAVLILVNWPGEFGLFGGAP